MNNPALSRAALVADIRRLVPAPHSLFLKMGDCVIEVRTSREGLRDELVRYFDEFLCPAAEPDILVTAHEAPASDLGARYTVKEPDPGKTKIKEEWADVEGGRIVHKRLTGMAFVFGGGDNVAVGPCMDNPNQVINFVNNRFIERMLDGGGLLGHAAGVALDGRGLAMAGFSGMGKSTLALHCMSRGADFVSNDRIMVRGNDGAAPVMYGVAKHPRINPGTALANPDLAGIVAPAERERFLALPQAELWDLEHKYDAVVADCFGPGRFHLKAPMTGLVLLNWRRDGSPLTMRVVDPRVRTDLLPAFMKATGLFYLPANGRPKDQPRERYAEVLSHCTVMEFSGGVDFDAAADACLGFLRTGRAPAAA